MRKKDSDYDTMLNVAKEELQEYDLHHWLEHHDMGNMKDHDAYQDQRKTQESIMDMDRRKIKYFLQLPEKNHMNR